MDEKKKLIILIALAVVVVGVGAFQFTQGAPAPEPQAQAKVEESQPLPIVEEEPTVPNPLFATPLPARDPFDPKSSGAMVAEQKPEVPKVAQSSPRPAPMVGKVEPLPPVMPGGFGGAIGVVPTGPAPDPDKFVMTVSGVFLGARPAAVFQDDQGNQRLVAVGEALDGDSRVVSVSRTAVKVRHKGKTVVLTVGGEDQCQTTYDVMPSALLCCCGAVLRPPDQ